MKKMYKEITYNDFCSMINTSSNLYGKKKAFIIKKDDEYLSITYNELKERYYALCLAFLDYGLKGKKIGIVGKNCFEWTLTYLAATTVGVAVPLDRELNDSDLSDFIDCAECALVCCEDGLLKEGSRLLEYKTLPFSKINEISLQKTNDNHRMVNNLEAPKDKTQVIIFTSGTTGKAKGVCLSQHNILTNINSTVKIVKIKSKDRTLSILPLHHTYECTLNCLLLLSKGACITYNDGLTKVAKNLVEYSPTILVAVPALLKVLLKRIKAGIIEKCPKKYRAYFLNYSLSEALKKTPFIIRKIIVNKVKRTLGGSLRLIIVGAAKLDEDIVNDFTMLNIRTLQGYGLTECAPLLAGNSDFYFNAASTGKAIPGVEIKINNPNQEGIGEIIARGDNIMLGYYNDPTETAKVLRGGWFHTGDLGMVDDEGALYITGRCKNVIVTDNGKNIYPEEIEAKLSEYSGIEEVLVVPADEQGKVSVKAKIFPNIDMIKEKLGHIPSWAEIEKYIKNIIDDLNKKNPSYKQIKILEVLHDVLEKTTTKKVKRFGDNIK